MVLNYYTVNANKLDGNYYEPVSDEDLIPDSYGDLVKSASTVATPPNTSRPYARKTDKNHFKRERQLCPKRGHRIVKVYVQNLNKSFTERDIRDYFADYDISTADIKLFAKSYRNSSSAQINFHSRDADVITDP